MPEETSHNAKPSMSLRFALVENDQITVLALSQFLTRMLPGSRCLWAASGAISALEKLDAQSRAKNLPDVLLVDMSLDGMQGTEFIRRIRLKGVSVPVLAMTSFPLNHYAAEVADAGAQGNMTLCGCSGCERL